MANLFQSIQQIFAPQRPLPAGMYAYQTPPDAEESYRLHLRIEPDGSGLLVINASTVLHLNQTAVEYAYHILQQTEINTVIRDVSRRYQVEPDQVREDFERLSDQIQNLIHTPDLDPVTYLDIERQEPYAAEISAPYRLDCALTYRVSAASQAGDAPQERVNRELETGEWLLVLQKAHDAGIPHLLFTGGEPTLREDLPEILQKAEELGLVTGLLSDGLKLGDDGYRQTLLACGLDHLMMIFDPSQEENWATLAKTLNEDLFTTVHLTLRNGENLEPIIQRLAVMGTNALSLSTADPGLADELQKLRDFAAVQHLALVWDLPVPYSTYNPVSLELEKGEEEPVPVGAGKAWLYVEPDGDVLPAQGMSGQILGNLLSDPWETIWQSR